MKEEASTSSSTFVRRTAGIVLFLCCLGAFALAYQTLYGQNQHPLAGDTPLTVLPAFSNEDILSAVTENALLKRTRQAVQYPTVLAPGMGDSCFNPGFSQLTTLVAERTKQKAICVGPGEDIITDMYNAFITTLDEQVEHFRRKVQGNPDLAHGFNAVGLSQGNLVIRAYSKCAH